jgi:hypothetical protein
MLFSSGESALLGESPPHSGGFAEENEATEAENKFSMTFL